MSVFQDFWQVLQCTGTTELLYMVVPLFWNDCFPAFHALKFFHYREVNLCVALKLFFVPFTVIDHLQKVVC